MKETIKYKVLRLQIPTELFTRFCKVIDVSLQEQVIFLIQDFVEAREMDLENVNVSRSSERGSTSDFDEFSG